LRRVHRTFTERFSFLAKYRCRECNTEETAPRGYQLHFGHRCRCPRCGTYRITKLKERDKIDKMETGFLNLVERWMGGKLYHCRYCRVQFFDRRKYTPAPPPLAPPKPPAEDENPPAATGEQSTATPGL
jgi:DNA-directed RNA polymerase subunit RPC12/RpoP